jgi:hypothetical protein
MICKNINIDLKTLPHDLSGQILEFETKIKLLKKTLNF